MTQATCTHGAQCERIHADHVVRVIYGPQLGYMQYGTVTEVLDGDRFRVHFPDGVFDDATGEIFNDLIYSEGELERCSA